MMNSRPTNRNTSRIGASTPPPVNGLPEVAVTVRARRMTSMIAMIETSVVSLVSVISCETVAGTIRRRPCGRITWRIAWR